ncbi:nucleotidyltransferase family protein [Microvirga sp. STR05]|uniref:Nucleotidyltransferase family protein n=1 Tax=Hymenobacter duratus TaxID=2771356 RepID=A0ABR8JHU6_9BACT|nr:nucleotidyltransferase family protein [Hymenobacter duratus]MBD2715173.1 nucleotidyltransferase family protein [Hymenobacter duratus]MBR7950080.1 nucleotidyltransferase family protein [Microvirga sp. STR05]
MPDAILLLAAGSSSRLGRPKQLLVYQGRTLLRRAAETAVAAAGGVPVVVVTGALHTELLPELAGLPVRVVRCPEWARGMGASLKTGLQALKTQYSPLRSVTVLLCDQPLVTPALLRQLAETHAATGRSIVASEYGGVRGVPVLFGAEALPLLYQVPDAAGAGQLLKQHSELVATVSFPGGALDVDTEAQYAALLAGPTATG